MCWRVRGPRLDFCRRVARPPTHWRRKIDSLATLAPYEVELVEFALDERLRLEGLDPVFSLEDEEEQEPETEATKPGRNDPCPCGSGKKFKKCCGT